MKAEIDYVDDEVTNTSGFIQANTPLNHPSELNIAEGMQFVLCDDADAYLEAEKTSKESFELVRGYVGHTDGVVIVLAIFARNGAIERVIVCDSDNNMERAKQFMEHCFEKLMDDAYEELSGVAA